MHNDTLNRRSCNPPRIRDGGIFAWTHSLLICGGGNDSVGYIAFISYAAAADLHPILILHGILLPMNVVRLMQIDDRLGRLSRPRSAYRRLLFLMAPKR